ncbi:MAG TPA: MraY family glycosyltransferase [Planctomycetota bacterium]|nr:MraY family glycosyltransferase [Planctomycetota bacterium]
MPPFELPALIWYALSFLLAATITAYVTPLTIHVAHAFHITDTPDGRLKKHRNPTPYLGGLAVAAGFVVSFGVLSTSESMDERALGILAGGFMMLMLGLYDDLVNLRPSVKFLGQVLAVVALQKAGVQIQLARLNDWQNLALTFLWVTGITNAFNIIDIMDGLATGTAAIAALFLFLISALVGGDTAIPFMAIVLAGALAGFLGFNVTPARIFLGDTGSLFIGFLLGALSMLVSYSGKSPWAVVTPVVLLAVPIFDTVFVAVHRARQGIPFFRGSPDHFALRVAHSGTGVRRTVLLTWRVAGGLGLISLLIVFGPPRLVPWVLGACALGALVAFVLLSRLPAPAARARAEVSEVAEEV